MIFSSRALVLQTIEKLLLISFFARLFLHFNYSIKKFLGYLLINFVNFSSEKSLYNFSIAYLSSTVLEFHF